jgi:hypothetical protein
MKACIFLTCLGWAASVVVAWGNGGGYSSGVTINGNPAAGSVEKSKFVPINLETIEMQTEDLRIDLFPKDARITVRYELLNPDGKKTATAAFPCVALASDMEEGDSRQAKFTDFELKLDGRSLPYAVKAGNAPKAEGIQEEMSIKIPRWYAFQAEFEPGQRRVLEATYRSEYGQYTETISDKEETFPATLTYLFSTAAIWKGPIKSGRVVIHAVGIQPDQVRIRGARAAKFEHRDATTWTWNFKDFKPTFADDLAIETSPRIVSCPSTYGMDEDKVEGGEYHSVGTAWTFELTDFHADASSALSGGKYQAQNVNKSTDEIQPKSCWAEGAPGDGIGEWLELTPKFPVLLDSVEIVNGLTASDTLFAANNRVKDAELTVNGNDTLAIQLPDRMTPTAIALPEKVGPIKSIRITIRSVYPGSKYQDTCITQVRLLRHLKIAPKIQQVR